MQGIRQVYVLRFDEMHLAINNQPISADVQKRETCLASSSAKCDLLVRFSFDWFAKRQEAQPRSRDICLIWNIRKSLQGNNNDLLINCFLRDDHYLVCLRYLSRARSIDVFSRGRNATKEQYFFET